MIKFNDRNIFTSYVKTLLKDFNLPTCKVFKNKAECDNFFKGIRSDDKVIVIIRKWDKINDYFVEINLKDLSKKELYQYRYNHKYPNLTKNLSINNGIYDTHAHKYLGDYLRFIRDYFDLNLMSLYNCYANETLFMDNYNYYLIPIKYMTSYTLFYNKKSFNKLECRVVSNIDKIEDAFNKEDNLIEEVSRDKIYLDKVKFNSSQEFFKENNLKLAIRLFKKENISFALLEGDFRKYNTYVDISNVSSNSIINNNFIQLNYEKNNGYFAYESEYNDIFNNNIEAYNFQLINNLDANKNTIYPFADRLIEYFSGNVITDLDKISKNIIDANYKADFKYFNKPNSKNSHIDIIDRFKMLEIVRLNKKLNINKEDLLGYVDKDIEKLLDDTRWVSGKDISKGVN